MVWLVSPNWKRTLRESRRLPTKSLAPAWLLNRCQPGFQVIPLEPESRAALVIRYAAAALLCI
jgi:hypothetical protein